MKLPPVSSPDSCWEASDHHWTEVEDEKVFDPWDSEGTTGSSKDIGLSKNEDKTGTERASTANDTVPMGSEDKEDRNAFEKATEDMGRADVEPMELADAEPSSNQDWSDEDLLYETEDDGSEYSKSGDSVPEDSDPFFDDLPEFDEDARQRPWEIEPEEEGPLIRRARDKAADITSLLDLTSRDDQEVALAYLTDLFEHYSHSSTFRAIKRIASASDGLDFETLKAMVELRDIWEQRTDWWRVRYSRRYRVRRLSNGETAFTWIAAHRVCLLRKDFPPEMMIDDDWLDEWLRLSPGYFDSGYMSFPQYIDVKMKNFDAELLEHGLSQGRQCEKDIDVFERHTAAFSVAEVGIRRR